MILNGFPRFFKKKTWPKAVWLSLLPQILQFSIEFLQKKDAKLSWKLKSSKEKIHPASLWGMSENLKSHHLFTDSLDSPLGFDGRDWSRIASTSCRRWGSASRWNYYPQRCPPKSEDEKFARTRFGMEGWLPMDVLLKKAPPEKNMWFTTRPGLPWVCSTSFIPRITHTRRWYDDEIVKPRHLTIHRVFFRSEVP